MADFDRRTSRNCISVAPISEHATDPRLGAAVRIPHLNWMFRGFYGYFYQAPPLSTATSQLHNFGPAGLCMGSPRCTVNAISNGSLASRFRYCGWTLSADNYETRARNWLDHNNIGESNIFWPITWDYAQIQGWELTLRSPSLCASWPVSSRLCQSNRAGNLAYHRRPDLPYHPDAVLRLDIPPGFARRPRSEKHLNVGYNTSLPWHAYASTNVYYGSGFANGLYGTPQAHIPGDYLPGHTTFDLALGKTFAEKYTVSLTALNVANRRVQLDNSLTFGGFHWNDPRQIYVEFRYRFHY